MTPADYVFLLRKRCPHPRPEEPLRSIALEKWKTIKDSQLVGKTPLSFQVPFHWSAPGFGILSFSSSIYPSLDSVMGLPSAKNWERSLLLSTQIRISQNRTRRIKVQKASSKSNPFKREPESPIYALLHANHSPSFPKSQPWHSMHLQLAFPLRLLSSCNPSLTLTLIMLKTWNWMLLFPLVNRKEGGGIFWQSKTD